MFRIILWGVLSGLVFLTWSCRCSEEQENATSSETNSRTEVLQPASSHLEVTEIGEKIIRSPTEPVSKAPPLLPGEKRRPRGIPPYPDPTEPDPEDGSFTLEQATEGLAGDGPLVALIVANLGQMRCTLYADQVPNTVANFVGLARGKRPWWDPYAGEWVRRPFYNSLTFYKVIPGAMIEGGCPLSRGDGGPGFEIDNEFVSTLGHDAAGVLSMISADSGGTGSRFLILDGAAPHLNGRHTVIGRCEPTDAIFRIARVPQARGNKPLTDVMIYSITIEREE